jgi:hypothetical protein
VWSRPRLEHCLFRDILCEISRASLIDALHQISDIDLRAQKKQRLGVLLLRELKETLALGFCQSLAQIG